MLGSVNGSIALGLLLLLEPLRDRLILNRFVADQRESIAVCCGASVGRCVVDVVARTKMSVKSSLRVVKKDGVQTVTKL